MIKKTKYSKQYKAKMFDINHNLIHTAYLFECIGCKNTNDKTERSKAVYCDYCGQLNRFKLKKGDNNHDNMQDKNSKTR